MSEPGKQTVERLYQQRHGSGWGARVARALRPPAPFVQNSREQMDAPLGRWNLYIGGGGCVVGGYVNLDLFPMAGVDVAADAARLPFGDDLFQRVECDAVLEHVPDADRVMREIERVLRPGGYAHIVTPFCHPFHEYPKDYRRFTPDGLCAMRGGLEVVGTGWRTGPTATMLVFTLEYVKMLLPWRWWRVVSHGVLGWVLFPFRYLDLWMLRKGDARRIGNHCYVWLRKGENHLATNERE